MSADALTIVEGPPEGPDVLALLEAHLVAAAAESPPESVHALDLEGLRQPNVTFFTVFDDGTLVGCGALKQLDAAHAEIKSMHTKSGHRGKGIASHLLRHLVAVSQARGYRRISLETGAHAPFVAARALYERFGFVRCPPFANYREDPLSAYMTLELESAEA